LWYDDTGKRKRVQNHHVLTVDAMKQADGRWSFRPFNRRLIGRLLPVAYVGLQWLFAPRVLDPHQGFLDDAVFSSPSLPGWLAWENGALSGIPPENTPDCDVIVEASVRGGMLAVNSDALTSSIVPRE
jgi:hypothetical protein